MGDFYLFDPEEATWANISGPLAGLPPSARINHGFTTGAGGIAYCFGGMQPAGTLELQPAV
jgi:hypothetical protein